MNNYYNEIYRLQWLTITDIYTPNHIGYNPIRLSGNGHLLDTSGMSKTGSYTTEPSRSSYQRILLIGPLAQALALARRYNWSHDLINQ